MNFLDLKDIEKHLPSLIRVAEEEILVSGEFTPIDCGMFAIRLSSGFDCFCKPKVECYTNIMDYTHVQVMIQEKSKQESDLIVLIQPASDERFKGFDWSKYFHYFDFKEKLNNSYIGSHVPIVEVPRLIKDVYKISRLKIFF